MIKSISSSPESLNEDCFLRRCGSLLLGLPADKAIHRILTLLGRANQADRSWVMRYDKNFTHFWNTHEWSRAETSKHVTDLQGIPVEFGAWLHESLLKDEHVYVADTKKMPRRAKALQTEFQRQGIRSLLCVPVFYRGKMMLQIGYDTTGAEVRWSDEQIDLLRKVGRLFALRLIANAAPSDFEVEDLQQDRPEINLQERGIHQQVLVADITHITADGDYCRMHFLDKKSHSDTRSLRYWESALLPRRFCRVSRSVIVNLDCIDKLDRRGGDWKLELRGVAEAFSVGRNYRADLKHRVES